MKPSSIRGFTLVELMVVIVVVAIVASLVLVNINRIDYRKAMQAREILLMDLQRIARESEDQSKILALSLQQSKNVNTYIYNVVEYNNLERVQQKSLLEPTSNWTAYQAFKIRELPNHVYMKITPTHYNFERANNTELLNDRAPELIWLGNGEVKPVTIQFYYEQQPIGAEIQIDYLGNIRES